MNISAIKKTLISSHLGRSIDSIFRLILSVIPYSHSIISQRKNYKAPNTFVFFLYGGIGDVVLVLPLLRKISASKSVILLCDKRISHLSFMFPSNAQIEIYNKKFFVKSISNLKGKIPIGESIFVQISPIIELYLVRFILGIPKAIGLISSFYSFRSIGLYSAAVNVKEKNKIAIYDKLYEFISDTLFFNEGLESIYKQSIAEDFQYNYIVISPMKSAEWDMGKINDIEYIKTAEHYVKFYRYKVIFVGSSEEFQSIESMIHLSTMSNMMINMAGKTNLEELSLILSNARFIIANDNGIAHISAYFNLKILVLFMFSDPKVYQWDGDNYAYIFNQKYNCMPCVGLSQYPKDNYPVICQNNLFCNKTISHIDILNKIKELEWY